MHKTITAKNSSIQGSSLFFHRLKIASIDSGVLRLQVPADPAAHVRINQYLAAYQLPVTVDVSADGGVVLRRVFERDRVLVKTHLPRWNEPGACAVINRSLGSLQERRAA